MARARIPQVMAQMLVPMQAQRPQRAGAKNLVRTAQMPGVKMLMRALTQTPERMPMGSLARLRAQGKQPAQLMALSLALPRDRGPEHPSGCGYGYGGGRTPAVRKSGR